ncbi:MAG: CPBP family intramembrane metalloprotease, partial [Chloroflexi bacterium]|nr:CPBP family intramembrane metalloprotease [Chloroflexota bacterium]
LPGVPFLFFFVIAAPLAEANGFPSALALFLDIGLVLIPVELGYLLYQGKKTTGRFSLAGVVLYREPMPAWQYVALGIPLFIWLIVILVGLSSFIDTYLIEKLFFWLPNWFFLTGMVENVGRYSQSALLVTAICGMVLNGIAGPIVEELYFRGYLLPRISRLGGWAPLVNVVLFSLYHFFSPWQNLGRIVAVLPMVYAVWWKRNIYLSMIVHCMANTLTSLALFALLLRPT